MKKSTLILFALFLSGCSLIPRPVVYVTPTPRPTPELPTFYTVQALFEARWVFDYAVVDGERTTLNLEAGDEMWIKFHDIEFGADPACQDFHGIEDIPELGTCMVGFDGCGPFAGVNNLFANGKFQVYAMSSTVQECSSLYQFPADNGSRSGDDGVNFSSEPVQQAITRAQSFTFDNDVLLLSYPESGVNHLIFRRVDE